MNERGWTTEWQTFHAAEADYQAAVEEFKRHPRAGGTSYAAVMRALERREQAFAALEKCLLSDC